MIITIPGGAPLPRPLEKSASGLPGSRTLGDQAPGGEGARILGEQAPGWIIWAQFGGTDPPNVSQMIQLGAPKVLAPWPPGAWSPRVLEPRYRD